MENRKSGKIEIFVIFVLVILIAITGCVDKGNVVGVNTSINVTPYPQGTPDQGVTVTPVSNGTSENGISSDTGNMIERYNLDKLISLSDSVVIAEVVGLTPSRWSTQNGEKPNTNDDTSYTIYTDVSIKILEYLKGSQNSADDNIIVTVRTLGGTVGKDRQYVEDQPSYNVNEKVLIFLKNDSDPRTKDVGNKHFVTTGSIQGKIPISASSVVIIDGDKMSLEEARIVITGKGENKYGNI